MVPAARTVWTAGGGGTLRAGLDGGARLGAGVELTAGAGLLRSQALHPVPGMPYYAELAAAVRF